MTTSVKILVIDDDEDDFIILQDYIRGIDDKRLIVEWCNSFKEAEKKIKQREYDLYFIDYLLGGVTGLDLIKAAAENNCSEPIILLTGNGNRSIDMQAMQYGAVDYLVKSDLNTEKLERCIRYSIERSNSLKALKNNESKYRNIFERSKDTIFIANEELIFTDMNNAALTLFERKRDELINNSVYDFFIDTENITHIKKELIKKDIVWDIEVNVISAESSVKNCIITISKEKDEEGKMYYQGIVHEITALKKAEKANLALEKMKMTSRLARTMAHEVRNPLNNILLALEQLGGSDDDVNKDIIKRNAKRINSLITELLNSSRSGDLILQKKSLQAILDDSLEVTSDRINLRNIQLQKDYINDHAWVMADNDKLKITFVNIIINAIEAMEKNNGKLLVSLKEKNDTQYKVFIADNGKGISSEDLVKLFDPYFTTKQNGVGLGLSSTLNILQSHNSSFDIESKPEKGTVFNLFFDKA